jgi:23S rRNA (guanosine2251-2'-O)-methyltransferase
MDLYGRNSVIERLKRNPKSIKKIFLQDNLQSPCLEKFIKENNVAVLRLSLRELTRIKRGKNLQGVVARVARFKYTPFDDLLNQSLNKRPTLIFLDRIFDPQNLGAIIRTAACFGGFVVVIPKFKACEVNETVLHVASGGENYVPIARVTNLSTAMIKARRAGYWIMGAEVSKQAEDINEVCLPFPIGLVLGSEGKGIRHGVDKHLDLKVRIPMQGAKLSFNVTVACAIFCHEISQQRGLSG